MNDTEKLAMAEEHIQKAGDAFCEVVEQMLKGNWTDDLGHPVQDNTAMVNMKQVFMDIMTFRHETLGYSKPSLETSNVNS